MKTIKITESQHKKLTESIQDGFSLAEVDRIIHINRRDAFAYCQKFLGKRIGKGIGRVVYELGDDTVLKVGINMDGDVQNENEYKYYKFFEDKFPNLFVKVYQHADDFSWLVCERVLPFHHVDSRAILGLPYYENETDLTTGSAPIYDGSQYIKKDGENDYSKYIEQTPQVSQEPIIRHIEGEEEDFIPSLQGFFGWCDETNNYSYTTEEEDECYFDLMSKIPWLKEYYSFVRYCESDTDIFDANLGIAMRDGKPAIVILDSGLEEIEV